MKNAKKKESSAKTVDSRGTEVTQPDLIEGESFQAFLSNFPANPLEVKEGGRKGSLNREDKETSASAKKTAEFHQLRRFLWDCGLVVIKSDHGLLIVRSDPGEKNPADDLPGV